MILCVAFSLDCCRVVCVSFPSTDDGFTCLQSFVTDCLTKDPSVKSEVAGALVILCVAFSLIVAALFVSAPIQ